MLRFLPSTSKLLNTYLYAIQIGLDFEVSIEEELQENRCSHSASHVVW